MTADDSELTKQFEAHEVDPGSFGHEEHLRVAYEMLHKYGFLDAAAKYAKAIQAIATRAGAPEKFNLTITLAFLSLIAERAHTTKPATFEEFLKKNRDLLSKEVLSKWYSDARLNSDLARTLFLLPRVAA